MSSNCSNLQNCRKCQTKRYTYSIFIHAEYRKHNKHCYTNKNNPLNTFSIFFSLSIHHPVPYSSSPIRLFEINLSTSLCTNSSTILHLLSNSIFTNFHLTRGVAEFAGFPQNLLVFLTDFVEYMIFNEKYPIG